MKTFREGLTRLMEIGTFSPRRESGTQTCTNQYDDLTRLVSNNCGSAWSQTFTYDAFGNISKSGTASFQPIYNLTTNRYNTIPGAAPAYDADGNVTADGFHNYSYDSDGKELQIDKRAVVMTYDALGRWVDRSAGGAYTQVVYGPDGRELVLTSGQSPVKVYVRLPGGAMADYEVVAPGVTGLHAYWHPDWLGTARLYTTSTRTVSQDVAVAPFGEWYPGEQADSFFTGIGQSADAGDTRFFPARNYHTTEGRWLTPDPAGLAAADLTDPQTWNRYAYVNNNPLGLVDPSGMSPFVFCTYGQTTGSGGGMTFTQKCSYFDNPYDAQSQGQNPSVPGYGPGINGGGGGGGSQQPAKNVQIATVLMPFAPKPANKQYCDSLAQKISNLRQTLRNKAYEFETNPQNLLDDVPGGKYSESQWGHLVPYINYQAALRKNETEYNNRCGGGRPSGFSPQVPIIAPPSFKIPSWLLFVGGAGALGIMAAPLVTAF
jgi:RHS repeat-associated protein